MELSKLAGERAKLLAQRDAQLAQLEGVKARILAERAADRAEGELVRAKAAEEAGELAAKEAAWRAKMADMNDAVRAGGASSHLGGGELHHTRACCGRDRPPQTSVTDAPLALPTCCADRGGQRDAAGVPRCRARARAPHGRRHRGCAPCLCLLLGGVLGRLAVLRVWLTSILLGAHQAYAASWRPRPKMPTPTPPQTIASARPRPTRSGQRRWRRVSRQRTRGGARRSKRCGARAWHVRAAQRWAACAAAAAARAA